MSLNDFVGTGDGGAGRGVPFKAVGAKCESSWPMSGEAGVLDISGSI